MNRLNTMTRPTPVTEARSHAEDQGDDAMHQLMTGAVAPAQSNAVPWRVRATALRDALSERIRVQPMRSMLIAASAGTAAALLAVLVGALGR